MGKRINLSNAAQKWSTGIGGAGQAWTSGIQSLTESPTQKAAQNVTKYATGVQEAVSSGRYVDGCNRVTLQAFQAACAAKSSNFAASGQRAKAKMERYFQASQSDYQRIKDQVDNMPGDTLEQRLEKARINAVEMNKLKGKYRQS